MVKHWNNSSAICRRIVWVCLTILWDWHFLWDWHCGKLDSPQKNHNFSRMSRYMTGIKLIKLRLIVRVSQNSWEIGWFFNWKFKYKNLENVRYSILSIKFCRLSTVPGYIIPEDSFNITFFSENISWTDLSNHFSGSNLTNASFFEFKTNINFNDFSEK